MFIKCERGNMSKEQICILLLIIRITQGLPRDDKLNHRHEAWMILKQGAGILEDSDVNAINNLVLKSDNFDADAAIEDNDYSEDYVDPTIINYSPVRNTAQKYALPVKNLPLVQSVSQLNIVPRIPYQRPKAEDKQGTNIREISEPIFAEKLPRSSLNPTADLSLKPVSIQGSNLTPNQLGNIPLQLGSVLQPDLPTGDTTLEPTNAPGILPNLIPQLIPGLASQSNGIRKPINAPALFSNLSPNQLANVPLDKFPFLPIDPYRNLPSILYSDTLDDDHFKLLHALNSLPVSSEPSESQFSSDDNLLEPEQVALYITVPHLKHSRLPDEMYGTKFKPVTVSDTVYVNHVFPSGGGGGGFMFPVKAPKSVFGYTRTPKFLGHFLHN